MLYYSRPSGIDNNSPMRLTILFLCLALALAAPNGDKVQIDFYYEALCPYCQQFLQDGVKTALGTKDIWKISDLFIHPYGNARTIANGSSYSFVCQHGPRECEGNQIELCAKNQSADYYSQVLPFVVCFESNTNDWIASGQKCASENRLNWASIQSCAYGPQGIQLHYEEGLRTNSLVPAHQYVPWITVNGEHNPASESAVRTNMVGFICNSYKGDIKIDACK